MTSNAVSQVICNLRAVVMRRDQAGLTDGQLLDCFITTRDEAAFEALVRRHGPMGLGVWRRVLGRVHDAEDAFQATFLVLLRKATAIVPREMVANWLHGVAYNTALKAKAMNAKRRGRERQVAKMPEPVTAAENHTDDLHRVLDKALRRLPDAYRVPVILCELEGKTYKEAARQLGVSESAISVRLVRARKMLARRLSGHGVALSAGSLALLFSQSKATASVPSALMTSTIKAVGLLGKSQAVTGMAISTKAIALAERMVKTMLLNKLKVVASLAVFAGALGLGAGSAIYSMQNGKSEEPVAQSPAESKPPTKETAKADPATKDQELIQGKWQAVSGETANEKLTGALLQGIKLTFVGTKVSMTRGGESGDASFTLDPTKTPKQIDLVVSDGSNSIGIYELDKDRLKLCLTDAKAEPRPTEFAGKGRQVLIVFKRVDPGKPDPAPDIRLDGPTVGERVLQEEVSALKAQLKLQESLNGRLKEDLATAKRELAGVLKKIDIAKNAIDVTLGATTLMVEAIPLATSAKFYLNGNECSINDLKEGMSVSLTFGADAEKSQVTAIRAVSQKNGQKE